LHYLPLLTIWATRRRSFLADLAGESYARRIREKIETGATGAKCWCAQVSLSPQWLKTVLAHGRRRSTPMPVNVQLAFQGGGAKICDLLAATEVIEELWDKDKINLTRAQSP
jgi:hypothetical protein